ncbi:aspartate aminotransferase family protein [Pedobacter sp. KBW06]|uniref:pyridoxal phosphate-dependent decarboxylase family protein n=1 Tax=Pedobacter sp. KBW06 TaxID=2153359 RepID=UPI000F5ABC18|nr:pyridoxal-dependent decarboxylase [Pedobacter sp. KBW06]RQO74598.1 aspartate aminotransferase family protein [Pedobacter sp. KBW06]
MNEILKGDLNDLELILNQVKAEGLEFLNGINDRRTSTDIQPMEYSDLEVQGSGTLAALAAFKSRFDDIIVASTGPRYWGFVTGGSTPAAIAGDWLATVYDQNTQTVKGQGDISANIELETVRLLLQLLRLPEDAYLGGFVTGATMSNFSCLAVARQWLGAQQGEDIAKTGVSGTLKVLSAMPHSSAVKSLALLGLGSQNLIKVKVMPGNREAMDLNDLEQQILELKGAPFILISSAGTVNTVDFDDFEAISKLRERYHFWWHIDAAFGAFAACAPAYAHLLKGWEQADSITVDCHKWLNVPYENAFFLVKKEHRLLQMACFQNSNAPYLGDPLDNFNYLNFLPENSRRLKALPAWFSLKAYGAKGYQDIVEGCIARAKELAEFIEKEDAFELLAPVRLNTVCFTLKGAGDKAFEFLRILNDQGVVFMTPTVYGGKHAIRAAFVNWRTTEKDVLVAIEELNQALKKI